jgi:hypothetical protein
MVWRLVATRISQEEFDKIVVMKKDFPPFSLMNCDVDFIKRCKLSSTHEGCIVFCMADGREPDIYEIEEITADVKPTFKGMQPKKYSFGCKDAAVPLLPGQIVLQTCGFRYCVNQEHLADGGRTRNQYTRTTDDE